MKLSIRGLVLVLICLSVGCAGVIQPGDTPIQKAQKIYDFNKKLYDGVKVMADSLHTSLPIADADWAKIVSYEGTIDSGFVLAQDALNVWRSTGTDSKNFYEAIASITKTIADIQDLCGKVQAQALANSKKK